MTTNNTPVFSFEDLKNSKCVLIHDRSKKGENFDKLKKILQTVFPQDDESDGSGEHYYTTNRSPFWYCVIVDEEIKNLPKVSVSEFYSNNFK